MRIAGPEVQLTDFEVLQALRLKGAHLKGTANRAAPSESQVCAFLTAKSRALDLTPALVAELGEALAPFHLSGSEKFQLLQNAPQALVELHLLVPRCAERFSDEQQAQLLGIFASAAKAPC